MRSHAAPVIALPPIAFAALALFQSEGSTCPLGESSHGHRVLALGGISSRASAALSALQL